MKAVAKKKTKSKANNFCEQLTNRKATREYKTSGLAVRRFKWSGTVAVPTAEDQTQTTFNKKAPAKPGVKQTVSLTPEGTPDIARLRQQVKEKGSKPTD